MRAAALGYGDLGEVGKKKVKILREIEKLTAAAHQKRWNPDGENVTIKHPGTAWARTLPTTSLSRGDRWTIRGHRWSFLPS
jgi:hypothetical protein